MFKKIVICVQGALFLAILLVVPAGADIIGVNWTGSVVDINSSTGVISPIANSGSFNLNSLTQDSAGTLYSAGSNNLLTINPLTGLATQVANLALPASTIPYDVNPVRALAFSPDNTLYAAVTKSYLDVSTGTTIYLWDLATINVTTGAATVVGPLNGAFQALDFSPDGSLYGWDAALGLGTINPTTGAFTDVSTSAGGVIPYFLGSDEYSLTMQSIAFASTDILYGHTAFGLYAIDIADGTVTGIGPDYFNLQDVRGIEISAPVPEPATMLLLASGLAGLAGLRRKFRK